MNRTPKLEVRRALRKEVGYGCPFLGCRSPYLTWHHFDPPWREKEHHDPAGMIALCGKHHRFADGGAYSKGELRALKESDPSPEDVKAHLPWAKKNFLVRAGGEYRIGSPCVLLLDDKPLIELARDESGFLCLSFVLESQDGKQKVAVEENYLTFFEDNLFDLEISENAKNVKVWYSERAIGLDLRFDRITPEELDQILVKDEKRHLKRLKKLGLPASTTIGVPLSELTSAPWFPKFLTTAPRELLEYVGASDMGEVTIKNLVQKIVREDCMEDDGFIPFLNFCTMLTYYKGARVEVREGIKFEGRGALDFNFGRGNAVIKITFPQQPPPQ
ncbi:hypothetical protein H6G00_34370 [Leptolyngbya sp. FACHB-541]|uniref:hypothetical protein n=1 Tax=Leptolyngbya sp. FACHB-541 TaxID=2692810 RepID=UPI001686C208|nr:hypothetical protein [Leptolyngbya sp. FACHB-541]MBD2001616.1 hypothetical protein [Leptolyngbya sp. FACHB-541]